MTIAANNIQSHKTIALDLNDLFRGLAPTISHVFFQLLQFVGNVILGTLSGGILGWIGGWLIGNFVQGHSSCSNPEDFQAVNSWYYLPHTYAQYGMVLGATFGILAVFLISRKMMQNKIAELYNNGTTKPEELAKYLDLAISKVRCILESLKRNDKLIEIS